MSRIAWTNVAAFVLALALSMTAAVVRTSTANPVTLERETKGARPNLQLYDLPGGGKALEDHSGARVPLRRYTRIVSGSTVADELLLALCEPDRILAFTGYGARNPLLGYRMAGKRQVEDLAQIEFLLSLKPDLVLVSNYGDPRQVQRLREAGLAVYDLGEMRGLRTLLPNIAEVAQLLGDPERGARFAASLQSRINRVASDIPASSRKRGMYLSAYGTKLFGGTRGSSFNDVLLGAGLTDAAADQYRDWPDFSAEQVLALDPPIIVTNSGMRGTICQHAGLQSLQACRNGGVIEIPPAILGDAGTLMLEAAELVRAAVYPPT